MLAPLIRLRYPDGALRVQDLDQLVAAAHQASDPRHFVAELVLDPPSSSADIAQPPHLDEDYLTLSTIHSAKGLEWDSVHVLAVYDGNFPACMAAGTSEEIDEERRLLYVGMTRARRHLTLYVPVRYHHRPHGRDDAHGYGKPSRFLTPEVLATCDVTRLPDDPLNPYGAPLVTRRRLDRHAGRAVRLTRAVAPCRSCRRTTVSARPRAAALDSQRARRRRGLPGPRATQVRGHRDVQLIGAGDHPRPRAACRAADPGRARGRRRRSAGPRVSRPRGPPRRVSSRGARATRTPIASVTQPPRTLGICSSSHQATILASELAPEVISMKPIGIDICKS